MFSGDLFLKPTDNGLQTSLARSLSLLCSDRAKL